MTEQPRYEAGEWYLVEFGFSTELAYIAEVSHDGERLRWTKPSYLSTGGFWVTLDKFKAMSVYMGRGIRNPWYYILFPLGLLGMIPLYLKPYKRTRREK